MLDVLVYSGIVLLFFLGIAPVILDVIKEHREMRAKRSERTKQ